MTAEGPIPFTPEEEAEFDAMEAAYLANKAANAYKEQRAAEYPSLVDQFDLLYHGGMDAWKAAIQAVKNKYPKPE
jgi:rhodanese-related sulfurtransferase